MLTLLRALLPLLCLSAAWAQATGTIAGQVLDPSGDAVAGARVSLRNPLSGMQRDVLAQADGGFSFSNLPFQTYTLEAAKDGFAIDRQDVPVRTNVPVPVAMRLRLAEHSERIEVAAFSSRSLIEPEATGTRTELNAAVMERMPMPPGTRGLEAVLLSFPGFAADANGAIHPRGAHNQMTYVVDGMPISDQLTGSFGLGIDSNLVETIELYTGNVPPEFGSKISGVANITTKSGLGLGRLFSGSTQLEAAQFDTLSQVTQLTGGRERLGYFVSLNTLKTHRFLDQVSLDNLHNGGNAERAFTRVDYQPSPRDALRWNLMGGRSNFELANLRSQQEAGQRQRQALRDFATTLGWLHTLSPRATFDFTASYRTSVAQLFPSPGDTPVTAAQARHLSTVTAAGRFNRVFGSHTLRAGADYQHFPVSENFSFAVTDPSFEAALPAFQFSDKAAGNLASAFVQDQVRWNRFVFSLGARYDDYRFLVNGHQLQPRMGVSFHIRETGTVLRASYNRIYQTPVNENLLLSNSEAAVRASASGGGLIRIRPQRQNVYEAGLQQSLGRRAGINAVYYHKDDRDLHDNDNFLNTGIIFPTSLARSRVNGAELRAVLAPVRALSGSLSLTHYHVVVTPPFTGGLFLGNTALKALSAGPFVIDHDQTLGLHGNLQYTLRRGLWVSTSLRYDSGLVTNPSDPQEVASDPDYADLLPYVNLRSDPPRVRPRHIVDAALGYERLAGDGRKRWSIQVQVSNVTNTAALYNFQSIFVGTRLVQPRTAGLRLRWFW